MYNEIKKLADSSGKKLKNSSIFLKNKFINN